MTESADRVNIEGRIAAAVCAEAGSSGRLDFAATLC
jgi:hypothetical protein